MVHAIYADGLCERVPWRIAAVARHGNVSMWRDDIPRHVHFTYKTANGLANPGNPH